MKRLIKGALVGTAGVLVLVAVAIADEMMRSRSTLRDAEFRSNVGRWSQW